MTATGPSRVDEDGDAATRIADHFLFRPTTKQKMLLNVVSEFEEEKSRYFI